MAAPLEDDEERKDPLVIGEPPRPTNDVVEQGQLEAAPQTAPTPTIETDAFARGAPPAPVQQVQASPAAAPVAETPQEQPPAFIPRDIPEPRLSAPVPTDPEEAVAQRADMRATAASMQQSMQAEEDKRARGVIQSLKKQGVETVVDPVTGIESPKTDDAGRTIYKPAVLSPFEDRGDGNLVSVHRDRFGNEQDVPLKPKTDPQTGEKYVTSADGVSRMSLGVDEDFLLRKSATEAGKIAAQARGELSLLNSRETDLKKQVEDYGGQAAMIAANKTPTPDDQAKLKQLQIDRQTAVKELDQLKQLRAQKSQDAEAATSDYLSKRKLILDKISGANGITPQQDATQPQNAAPPEVQSAIADAKAGKKPYTLGKDNSVQFSQQEPLKSLDAAVADGLISKDFADQHRDAFADVQKKFDDLKKSAGNAQVLKAVLHGAGMGTAFIAGSIPGAKIGAVAGALVPGAGETGISEGIGAVLGGLAGGTAAAFAARKGVEKLAQYNDSVKSLVDAAQLHPVADAAGELVGFAANPLKAGTSGLLSYSLGKPAVIESAANLYRLGKMEGGIGKVAQQIGVGAAGGAIFEGAVNPAIEAGKNFAADALGIKHDKFQGPTATGFATMVGLGILTAGHNVAFHDYSANDIASILLRGKVRAVAGVDPTAPLTTQQVVDTMQHMGVDVDSAGAELLKQPLSPMEAALHKDLATRVQQMEARGDFEGAAGAQFTGGTQAVLPSIVPGRNKVLSQGVVEVDRGGGGNDATGTRPTSPDVKQLADALTTHRADLAAQRDMLQSHIDDPAHPAAEKPALIAQVADLDKQISALPEPPTKPVKGVTRNATATTSSNEQGGTDETPVAPPESGGQPSSRPVPDQSAPVVQDEPRQETPANADVRQGQHEAAGAAPSDAAPDAAAKLLNATAKSFGIRYDGPASDSLHQFTDPKSGSSFTMPKEFKSADLRSKLDEVRKRMSDTSGIDEFLADKDPTKQPNEGGITDSAAVSMATKLVGTKPDNPVVARQTLADHKQGAKQAGVDVAAHEAATSPLNERPAPSMAQHEAGNAKLGHHTINGLDVSIENPQGSIRTNVDIPQLEALAKDNSQPKEMRVAATKAFAHFAGNDPAGLERYAREVQGRGTAIAKGQPWANKMTDAHYGYIKRTEGTDGDHVDVFIKPGTPDDYNGPVFVIHQHGKDGRFDEYKSVVGATNAADALRIYKSAYPPDWKGAKNMVQVPSVDEFKKQLAAGAFSKPPAGEQHGSNKQEAATVPVRQASETGEGKGEVGQGVREATGDSGRLRNEAEAAPAVKGRANRLLNESMAKGKTKATLDALGVQIVKGTMSFEAGFSQGVDANDLVTYKLALNPERIDELTAGMSDAQARDYVAKGLSEEIIHFAQFEAFRRTWDGKGNFGREFEREYQNVAQAMTPEERSAVQDAYSGQFDGETAQISGGRLGAEFVRQLLQTEREGEPTEATIRAKPIIERILAVLKKLLADAKAWSEPLQRAYDRTKAVLEGLERKSEPVAKDEPRPVARTNAERIQRQKEVFNERQTTSPAKTGPPEAATPAGQATRTSEAPGRAVREPEQPAAATVPAPTSGASDALKDKARDAFKGLFASQPRFAAEQEPLPKDRRAGFMDLADAMEAEGITTPDKVGAFLSEVNIGLRKYSRALWKVMESTGAVHDTAAIDWNEVYSALDKAPNESNIQPSGDSDANRPGSADAGAADAAEDRNAGAITPTAEVSGEGVPAARGAGSGERTATDVGRSGVSGEPADTSRGDVGASAADRSKPDNRGTEVAGRHDRGGTEAAGPAARDFSIGSDTVIAPSGNGAKLKANVSAIRILKRIESDKRPATPEEQSKLAQYTGWGHSKEAFNDLKADLRGKWNEDKAWTAKWGDTYDSLKKLLTPTEWKTAAESTLNAHYTARPQIEAMWNIVRRLGFEGGRVLEPAVGVGHFFGLMPQDLRADSKLFGTEMDGISSRVAQALYPTADIKTARFEKAKLPNNYFDLVVSNFPFHEVGPVDDRYPSLNLHNYFFARSFDLVKPGGLIVAITSNSTLDNNPEQRAFLQKQADLVGAIRLPNTAFRENAGTEVTTDILVFRKPDSTPFKGESFLNTTQVGTDQERPVVANEYFQRHPEMALGTHSLQGTMYRGDSYALAPDKYRPVEKALPEAIANLPEGIASHSTDFYAEGGANSGDHGLADVGEKEGSVSFKDGKPMQALNGVHVTPDWAKAGFRSRMRDPLQRVAAAKSFVTLRDTMKALLAEELNPAVTDATLSDLRSDLRKAYDAHVKKFGNLEKGNLKFLESDPEYYLVMGLEIVGKERQGDAFVKKITPADILSQRTLFPTTPPSTVADVADGARVSMQFRGKIDPNYIAELTKRSVDDVESELTDSGLVFKNPKSGLLETRDMYLSANVRQKLREAEKAAEDDPRYQKNVEELKAVQPDRVSFENVTARAGSAWIPLPVYEKFVKQILGNSAKVTYTKTLDRWGVSLGDYNDQRAAANQSTYGTERITGAEVVEDVLNLRNPRITDTIEDVNAEGKKVKRTVVNKEETDKARDKARRVREEFDTHIRQDPDARSTIEDAYNESFNSYVVPKYDGSHLIFPGMAASYKGKAVSLRPHQKDVVYRITQTGGTLMAHGVGGGKTIAQIAAAMEMRRLGLAQKPLVVVDKPTIGQFASTWRQIYPNANVLVATEDSFSAANRKRFMSRIATGNWDAVVMSNSQFDLMPSNPDTIASYVQTNIDQLKEIAADAAEAEGKQSPKVRMMQTEIKRLEKRLESVLNRLGKRQDDTIYFEQTGIDYLDVDEAHAYKKVPFTTKMDPVKGIDRNPSQRAINLHPKIQHVQANNRGRNVVLATGTPVTNTLAEAWNMTRLVAPQLLEDWGVDTFDRFVSTFAETVDSTEINAANQWVSVERLSKFTNGPELVKLIRTAWDVRMGEDLKGLDLPDMRTGKPQIVALEITPEQTQITKFLQDVYKQFGNLTGKERRAASWVPIVTMGTGMAASTDPRLVDPRLPDNPHSLVNKAVESIARIYHDTAAKRSTQIVFLDRFRPMNTEKLRSFSNGEMFDADELGDLEAPVGFNLYDDIRDKLVAAGIPREEIAIANEHDTEAKRLRMQEDMQTGRVRVLMGSTAKIGQGINVQDKLIAAHHLDPPIQMTPAQYIQRNGRIIRDGNENPEVDVFTYGMKRTLAAGIWQRIETKAKFIVQVLMGKGVGREFEDPADEVTMSIAEQVAELTGDKRVLQKVELESKVRSLQTQRQAFYNNLGSARENLRKEQSYLENLNERAIPSAERDKAFFERNFGEDKPFVAKIGTTDVADEKAFDERWKEIVEKAQQQADDYFKETPKAYGRDFTLSGTINGAEFSTSLRIFNPEKSRIGGAEPSFGTTFSTPNSRSIANTGATTGKGIVSAINRFAEKRDERIADLKQKVDSTKSNIAKLEQESAGEFKQQAELDSASQQLADIIRDLAGPAKDEEAAPPNTEPVALTAPEPKQSLISAYQELPATEKKVVALKMKGADSQQIAAELKMTPVAVETAYNIALQKLNKARATGADVRAKLRSVAAEKPGERTQGRPDLANPAKGPMSRRFVDTIDELRKDAGIPTVRDDNDVSSEASRRLDADYGKEKRALFKKASTGDQLDDVETVMAKRVVAKESLRAIKSDSDKVLLDVAKLVDAYRMSGTIQARAFRQRQDTTMSPEERAAQYIGEAILTPDSPRRKRLAETDDLAQREAILRDWLPKIARIKKELAALGIDLDKMGDDELKNVLKDRVKAANAIRAINTAKADVWDKLYEYWLNGLVSNPTTVGAKVMSDVAHGFWEFTAQRMTEALVNVAVRDPSAAHFSDFKYIAAGILPGLSRGVRNAMMSWRTERPVLEDEIHGDPSEFAKLGRGAIGGTLGKVVRTPTRMMLMADQVAKGLFGQIEAGVMAHRIAAFDEKLTGPEMSRRIAELMDDMESPAWAAGLSKADMLTFQTHLGSSGNELLRLRNKIPGVRYILPFVRTIGNIFKTGIRKSPVGLTSLLYRLAREGAVRMEWDKSGWRYTANQATSHIAEQILAWGALAALYSLVAPRREDGLPLITGTVPYEGTKRGERDLAYRTAPPLSVRIGDKWYSYNRVEPFGVAIGTSVDLLNTVMRAKNGEDYTAAIGKTMTHFVAQLKDKTFARGIGDVLNAIQDGEHAAEWAADFAVSWVPNIVKSAARATDENLREQGIWGRGEDWFDNFLNSAAYKALPYANEVIQPKIDLWGREITKDAGISPATDWLYRMMVPVATQSASDDKILAVDRAITNWNNAHPNDIFAPQPPAPFWSKKIGGKEQTIYMSRDEYRQTLEMAGAGARGRVEVLGINPDAPTKENIDDVKKALQKARKDASDRVWELHLAKKLAA